MIGIQIEGPRAFYEFYKFGYRCNICNAFLSAFSIDSSVVQYIVCSEHYPIVRKSHVCKNGHDNFGQFFNDNDLARMREEAERRGIKVDSKEAAR